MKVNPYIFRGYDLRGLVGKDLSAELAEHLGRGFGTMLKNKGILKVVVGFDCRPSSPEYSEALIKGLNWCGIDVVNIGLTFVGTFYWAQYFLKCQGGVYVTASHNPAEYNGFKFANNYSETLVSEGMQELRALIETENYLRGEKEGKTVVKDIRQDYYKDLVKRVKISKKLKVLVDPSQATGSIIIPDLLRLAGCEVIEKNTKLDGNFPLGTPDPTEKIVMDRVGKETVEAGADVGFTYDADGDRIGVVDEKGGVIWNDVLLALYAANVLSLHPEATIMFNMLCSKVVSETIIKHGGKPFLWRVGHSFLKNKNQEIKAAFIGELSGHFFFSADFYNHDDGAYSTLRLLNYLAGAGKPLSQLVAELPLYVSSPEVKVFCADDKKEALISKLSPLLKKDFPTAEIIDDERAGDGLRLELPDGMFVVRYSQNGPYLTVKFEGKTKARYEELRKYIGKLLRQYPEIDWTSKINVNLESLE